MDSSNLFETEKPVSIIDRFQLKSGAQQAVHGLMTRDYAAHVAPRGLRLVGAWLTPPFERPDAGSELIVVWEYPSVGALWAVRMDEEDDPVAKRIWSEIAALTEGRSRQLARSEPMDLPGPDNSGAAVTSGGQGMRRSILFVRPLGALSAADQAGWIASAEGLATSNSSVLASRAGFHQEYSFMPEHFTWDIAARGPTDPAALLAALPGPAEIVDSVELNPLLDVGVRDPAIGGTKRTILIRTKADLPADALAAFEATLAATPRYITAIRNWRFSRVSASRGAVDWTHCIEQEAADPLVFVGDYLNHPYHWAVVERLFHPDGPEPSTNAFSHTLYPISRSVLAEVQTLAA